MDPAEFLEASRVVIVAGKGGVGKTTVSAALAQMAADAGLKVLVVGVDGDAGLSRLFRVPPLTYETTTLGVGIEGRVLTPDDALLEYLESHGLRRITKRLLSSGAIDVVATAAPGIRDILVLGKVKQLERSDEYDLVVVDAPAAGHAITFLSSARSLADIVRVGPVHTQAADVLELLGAPERCSVLLVTIPEETPVNELVETAFALEDRVGVKLGPVVVNGLYPPVPCLHAALEGETHAAELTAAARFRAARTEQQCSQVARLDSLLPLPQIQLPFLFATDLGPTHVQFLADALADQVQALA